MAIFTAGLVGSAADHHYDPPPANIPNLSTMDPSHEIHTVTISAPTGTLNSYIEGASHAAPLPLGAVMQTGSIQRTASAVYRFIHQVPGPVFAASAPPGELNCVISATIRLAGHIELVSFPAFNPTISMVPLANFPEGAQAKITGGITVARNGTVLSSGGDQSLFERSVSGDNLPSGVTTVRSFDNETFSISKPVTTTGDGGAVLIEITVIIYSDANASLNWVAIGALGGSKVFSLPLNRGPIAGNFSATVTSVTVFRPDILIPAAAIAAAIAEKPASWP